MHRSRETIVRNEARSVASAVVMVSISLAPLPVAICSARPFLTSIPLPPTFATSMPSSTATLGALLLLPPLGCPSDAELRSSFRGAWWRRGRMCVLITS